MASLSMKCVGHGEPLVFFHGWGFDHQVWLPLVDDLTADYACYLVDLPGFGLSPQMDWFFFKSALLSRLPEPFRLIGWSMGGLFATRFALEVPQAVRCLINVASSPRFLAEKDWPGIDAAAFRAFSVQLRKNPEAMIARFRGMNEQDTPRRKLPPLESLKTGLGILAEWDLRAGLSDLIPPTTYLWGRFDPIVPCALMNQMKMQIQYPSFKHVIFERSEHMPFLTEKDRFLSTLKQRLSILN